MKKQAGCPPTTNRIGFALPDSSDNAREKDEKFYPLPRSWFRGIGRRNREGLENFCTGRDRRDLAKISRIWDRSRLDGPIERGDDATVPAHRVQGTRIPPELNQTVYGCSRWHWR